jgi:hypothetical protein
MELPDVEPGVQGLIQLGRNALAAIDARDERIKELEEALSKILNRDFTYFSGSVVHVSPDFDMDEIWNARRVLGGSK